MHPICVFICTPPEKHLNGAIITIDINVNFNIPKKTKKMWLNIFFNKKKPNGQFYFYKKKYFLKKKKKKKKR